MNERITKIISMLNKVKPDLQSELEYADEFIGFANKAYIPSPNKRYSMKEYLELVIIENELPSLGKYSVPLPDDTSWDEIIGLIKYHRSNELLYAVCQYINLMSVYRYFTKLDTSGGAIRQNVEIRIDNLFCAHLIPIIDIAGRLWKAADPSAPVDVSIGIRINESWPDKLKDAVENDAVQHFASTMNLIFDKMKPYGLGDVRYSFVP